MTNVANLTEAEFIKRPIWRMFKQSKLCRS